jgi:hypothetical protein
MGGGFAFFKEQTKKIISRLYRVLLCFIVWIPPLQSSPWVQALPAFASGNMPRPFFGDSP